MAFALLLSITLKMERSMSMLRKLSFILAFAMLFSAAPNPSDLSARMHHVHHVVKHHKRHRIHRKAVYRTRRTIRYTPAVEEHHSYSPKSLYLKAKNRINGDDEILDAQERR